uniref:Putative secreted protein n=1 Tax=Ixodes scapularis TaxID=6945 RepID=A0A4D5RAJ0_IXOSC
MKPALVRHHLGNEGLLILLALSPCSSAFFASLRLDSRRGVSCCGEGCAFEGPRVLTRRQLGTLGRVDVRRRSCACTVTTPPRGSMAVALSLCRPRTFLSVKEAARGTSAMAPPHG